IARAGWKTYPTVSSGLARGTHFRRALPAAVDPEILFRGAADDPFEGSRIALRDLPQGVGRIVFQWVDHFFAAQLEARPASRQRFVFESAGVAHADQRFV